MPLESSERKKIYRRRKTSGCCPRCGAKKGKNSKFSYCDDCRGFFRNYNREMSESFNEQRKARYKQRKKNNECPRCGKKLGKAYGKTICASCLKKQYSYNNR